MKNKYICTKLQREINKFINQDYQKIDGDSKIESKKRISDFIDKMAVWYELRYPNDKINKMFNNLNDDFDYENEELYNFNNFYNVLSTNEKNLIKEAVYPRLLYLKGNMGLHIHPKSDGTIGESDIKLLKSWYNIDSSVKICTISELVAYFTNKGIKLDSTSEVMIAKNEYEKQKYIRENILDSVMYKIIIRGDKNEGVRRAFLFAKEFDRHMYLVSDMAVENNDYNLLASIREYLESFVIINTASEKIYQKSKN